MKRPTTMGTVCRFDKLAVCLILIASISDDLRGQDRDPSKNASAIERLQALKELIQEQTYANDMLAKRVDDLLWYQRLGDIAKIGKIRYTGPARYSANPTAQDAGTALVVEAYEFIPRKMDPMKKYPLLVFPHGGVHGNFRADDYGVVVRELVEQGYFVVAPDYRGSTGYGRDFYNQIDYGGKEIEDVYLAGQWMLKHYAVLDPQRVGILGWSHGGFLTLWNIFKHPEGYKAAYAGVPVSNLALRAGTKAQGARGYPIDDYGAPSGIGKSAFDDVQEYIKRSPTYNADKLQTPLLIHTDTNDSDVNVFEVQQLIDALQARGKKFEYKIYQEPPGEHIFELLDTEVGRQARLEVYQFLARFLNPPNSIGASTQ